MSIHSIQSWWSRKALACSGVVATLVMLGVSMSLNYDYGYSLGASHRGGQAIGLAMLSADVVLAVSPFMFFAAKLNREWAKALLALVLWVAMTGIAAWSAISQISFHRMEATSGRQVVAINYDDLRKEIQEARQELGFIPQARPEMTVRADITGQKVKALWSQTSECDEGSIAGKSAREYCQNIQKLQGELAAAQQAAKVRAKIEALVAKSERQTETKGAAVVGEADAGASTLANLTGLSLRTTQSMGALMLAVMLLLTTSTGLYVFVGTLRAPKPEAATPADIFDEVMASHGMAPGAPNLALGAPSPELLPPPPPKSPSPPEPPKPTIDVNPGRSDPIPEARAMLTAIGYPEQPMRGELRPKGPREHVGWRFFAWIRAHGLEGEYPWQAVDELYGEFSRGDHREPWALRIAKVELEKVQWVNRTDTPVVWTFKSPPIEKLMAALKRRDIIGAAVTDNVEPPAPPAPPPGKGNVVPLIPPPTGAANQNKPEPVARTAQEGTVGWAQLLAGLRGPRLGRA